MQQIILYADEARAKLYEGIKLAADIARTTIGPKGTNVTINGLTTNDGVTAVNAILHSDPVVQIGVDVVKGVANKTSDIAGDATTTSIILTDAFAGTALEELKLGKDGMTIRSQLLARVAAIQERLNEQQRPASQEDLVKIATTSSESKFLGELVADVVTKVGPQGIINLSMDGSVNTTYDIESGYRLEKGVLSTTMLHQGLLHLENIRVLVADKKFSDAQEILSIMEKCAEKGIKELVIICEELSGKALQIVLKNNQAGTFKIAALRGPISTDKKEVYQDVATYLGAKLIGDESASVEEFTTEMLGAVAEIKADAVESYLISGQGSDEDIEARVQAITAAAEKLAPYDRKKLDTRLARLTGGYATISIGAATQKEVDYLRLKIHNAVNATRNAVKYGVVPGGGVALYNCRDISPELIMPFFDIKRNCGNKEDIETWIASLTDVIDSYHSVMTAVHNAISEVGIFITTGVVIADKTTLNTSEEV